MIAGNRKAFRRFFMGWRILHKSGSARDDNWGFRMSKEIMKSLTTLIFVTLALSIVFAKEKPDALARTTWSLVRVDNLLPDGSRTHLYGDEPQGLLIFDGHGRYSLQIMRAGRPKFAANDKSKGTSEENQAAVQGSNAHFGTYSLNAASGSLVFRIEHASFPNWEGTEQKRSYVIKGDRLNYTDYRRDGDWRSRVETC